MSIFRSEKVVAVKVADLEPVSTDLVKHFQERGYEATQMRRPDDAWEVSITKGGLFKAAVGLRTALKVQLVQQPGGTLVRAGAGVFGKQAVPAALTLFVAWPVLLAQVWGLINQAGLDDEAIKAVELSLNRLSRLSGATDNGLAPTKDPSDDTGASAVAVPLGAFCPQCGHRQTGDARYCPHCGASRAGHVSST
ncbi:zinc ribbon domain-containing protein [Streptomyces phaeochromogenes]